MATAPKTFQQQHRAEHPSLVTVDTREKEIAAGSVLLLPNAPLPDGCSIGSRIHNGWRIVSRFTAVEFGKALRRAGWHYTNLVGEIRAVSWGRTSKAALERVLRKAKRACESRLCNSIEITAIKRRRVFRFERVMINAVARHVSKTPYIMPLRSTAMARVVEREWNRHRTNALRDPKLRRMTLRHPRPNRLAS